MRDVTNMWKFQGVEKALVFFMANFFQDWVNGCWVILIWFTYNLDSISAILKTNNTQGKVFLFFLFPILVSTFFFTMRILNFGIMSFDMVHADQIISYTCTNTSLVQLGIFAQVNSVFNEPDDMIQNLK